MAQFDLEIQYRCSDDCVQSGCPSHTLTLTYNSVVDRIVLTNTLGDKFVGFERNEIEAFIELLLQLRERRADSVDIKKLVNKEPTS